MIKFKRDSCNAVDKWNKPEAIRDLKPLLTTVLPPGQRNESNNCSLGLPTFPKSSSKDSGIPIQEPWICILNRIASRIWPVDPWATLQPCVKLHQNPSVHNLLSYQPKDRQTNKQKERTCHTTIFWIGLQVISRQQVTKIRLNAGWDKQQSSSRRKMIFQKYNIWGWNSPTWSEFRDKIEILITHIPSVKKLQLLSVGKLQLIAPTF